jgi:hypothetical protein
VLAVDQVVFGDRLGDPDPMAFETLTSVLLGAGLVDFAQVSFLSTAELMDLQPAGFRLATISFSALASGSAPLTLSQIRVDDPFGNKISIPGPGTLPLLLIGCIPTVLCRRRGDGSCSVRAERQGDAD